MQPIIKLSTITEKNIGISVVIIIETQSFCTSASDKMTPDLFLLSHVVKWAEIKAYLDNICIWATEFYDSEEM